MHVTHRILNGQIGVLALVPGRSLRGTVEGSDVVTTANEGGGGGGGREGGGGVEYVAARIRSGRGAGLRMINPLIFDLDID